MLACTLTAVIASKISTAFWGCLDLAACRQAGRVGAGRSYGQTCKVPHEPRCHQRGAARTGSCHLLLLLPAVSAARLRQPELLTICISEVKAAALHQQYIR